MAALINLLGWTMGVALYAMLLVMALRSAGHIGRVARRDRAEPRGFDFLPLATAVLGLVWNTGSLATYGLHDLGISNTLSIPFLLLGAASLSALGFLPAVVVHSAIASLPTERDGRSLRMLIAATYTLSTVAAVMHFYRALVTESASSNIALRLLTIGFGLLIVGLFLLTRREPRWRRAVWATALAVFAVSALHLSRSSNHEAWYAELVGHHASLPLAFAILYQDYRFAFADIFLKRALSLLALVLLITVTFSLYVPFFAPRSVIGEADRIILDARSLGVLLALWAGTALLYPWLGRAASWFVDKVVLRRVDYAALRTEVACLAQEHQSPAELLDDICVRLQPSLTAQSMTWREVDRQPRSHKANSLLTDNDQSISEIMESSPLQAVTIHPRRFAQNQSATVTVPTSDEPGYELTVGELVGGRRLLSDDIEMLESVAVILARRVDAMRVTHERCEQVQREQEIAKLATEAQLRALRAQINPHFLFNALTTIGYLIQTSPTRALETLLRLTDLLRRVLRVSEEWTTLGEELKLIESYLDIERARFEERLRVRFDVPWELQELLVPSLVVQPIVENAVKHGITPLKAGGEIHIAARLEGEVLIISVRDTGAGIETVRFVEGRRNGVGLDNVEQRLRLCCGDEGQLHFESAPDAGAMVELRVPVRKMHAAARMRPGTSGSTATEDVNARPRNASLSTAAEKELLKARSV